MVNLTVISLFAGCGGSSLGYKIAGFEELLAIEWDKKAVEIFKLNFPNIPIWQKDICKVSGKQILKFCKIKKGELDILDSSPPYQGFSTAGKRQVSDPRNNLFLEFYRILQELEPKVFVIENVTGIYKGKMKGRFLDILNKLKTFDYKVKCKKLNAANYSVPQSRERVFFIGVRNDLNKEPIFPIPQKKIITVGEAIGDLDIGKAGKHKKQVIKAWYKSKPGQSLRRTCHFVGSFQSCRLDKNKVSPTLVATHRHWHYKIPRKLNDLELKRICSFPDNFILVGNKSDICQKLGNAVMPLQMKAIAETIKEKILLKDFTSKKAKLIRGGK